GLTPEVWALRDDCRLFFDPLSEEILLVLADDLRESTRRSPRPIPPGSGSSEDPQSNRRDDGAQPCTRKVKRQRRVGKLFLSPRTRRVQRITEHPRSWSASSDHHSRRFVQREAGLRTVWKTTSDDGVPSGADR